MPFTATQVDLEMIRLGEAKSEKDKQHITYMWDLKHDGIHWPSNGQDPVLSLPRAQVQSMAGEPRSHKPWGTAKKYMYMYMYIYVCVCVCVYKDTNEFIYAINPQTQRTDFVVAQEEGGGGGIDWEFGISRCKLLYIGWTNNRELYLISCDKS